MSRFRNHCTANKTQNDTCYKLIERFVLLHNKIS